MAPHRSTLAWKIPWMEDPGRLQSMGSRRVRHDSAISLLLFTSCIGEGNGNPLQCSCLENLWIEEPGGQQSLGSQRAGHNWSDSAHTHANRRISLDLLLIFNWIFSLLLSCESYLHVYWTLILIRYTNYQYCFPFSKLHFILLIVSLLWRNF